MDRETTIVIDNVIKTIPSVTISAISIEVFKLILNTSIELRVIQKTSSGSIHSIDHIIIDGTDYSSINTTTGGNRDQAIINKVLDKLSTTPGQYKISTSPA
jgi:hypothetical protein